MNEKNFKILATPYKIWLYVLALFPVLIMILLSFVKSEGVSTDELVFSFDAFLLFKESSTLIALFNSFFYASISTICAAFIGYFVAYRIFKSGFNNKFLVLVILILPMWSNLLLRTEALGNLMEPNNILSNLLSKIGIHLSLNLRGSAFSVVFGLTLTYLPFMILPIYNALEKIDYKLEEAALDLGLTHSQKFRKVIFPLSKKGLYSGSIMVFLPTLTGFAVPQILGKGNIVLIGNVIEESFRNMNYNFGSLLALFLIIFIFISIILSSKISKEGSSLI